MKCFHTQGDLFPLWGSFSNSNSRKSNRLTLANQQLCTCIVLFCTFFSHHCMTTINVKVPNFTFCRGQEQSLIDNNFLFLFLNFDTVLNNSTPKKFANIWQIKRDGICPIKFEVVRKHLLIIDIFSRCHHCCLSSLLSILKTGPLPHDTTEYLLNQPGL